jgi:hypothetical protein
MRISERVRTRATLLLAALLCWSVVASAQRIVLLRPKTADPALLQAFGRLQGELSVHDFEVTVVDAVDDPSPRELADVAERSGAVAAISLLRSQGLASADVWISDRVTGKTSMRSIATDQQGEAPSVLAIRAVDLLRTSLREFSQDEKPPAEIIGATPSRAPEHVRVWAEKEVPRTISLEASFAVSSAPSPLGLSYGPAIAAGFAPGRRLHLQAGFQGPLSSTGETSTGVRLVLKQEQFFAQLGYRFSLPAGLTLEPAVLAGGHHISVQGDTALPYAGQSDSAWTGLAGLGLGVEISVIRGAAIILSGRVAMLAPRPVVQAAGVEYPFGRPLLAGAAGLRVWF